MGLQDYIFDNLDQCVAQAKYDIDVGVFDKIAEGVYVGLSVHGNDRRFAEMIRPYYEQAKKGAVR